ncbi:MAG: ATP synthase F1 subunit epsilon [Anaerolineales bacterium]|nr:ATP synthase F1 subunit epsilon [Anaerolineales bacterium]MCW5855675.1 ATP synthase F1 subunit epsilon [Anaerolineales bacterium]
MTIRCEIVSQDRAVFQGDADIVVVPGTDGEMGILPRHVPLLSTLGLGVIKVRQGTEEHLFTVTGGLVEVQPDIVTILADAAEDVGEIDIARAEEARRRAEQRLAEGPGKDAEALLAAEAALRRSSLRLDVARKYGRTTRRSSQFPTSPSGE